MNELVAAQRRGSIHPGTDPFLTDVIHGLWGHPRTIPCKYLWDARGSALFERLGDTPEYYLTRAERELFAEHAADIAGTLGPEATLVELGPGNAHKTLMLIERAERLDRYVPIDVDAAMLERITGDLAEEHAELSVDPIVADYASSLPHLPRSSGKTVVLFAGSSIGNFHPSEAVSLLSRCARAAGSGAVLLIGVDLKKSKRVIEAAYDDKAGITAAFNRNVLVRINREIGATFDVTRFSHRAPYDPIRGRVEMRLVSDVDQRVSVDRRELVLAKGEWIVTEHSYKYEIDEVRQLARRAGVVARRVWTDAQQRVSLHELLVP